jgi:hypothetical protein
LIRNWIIGLLDYWEYSTGWLLAIGYWLLVIAWLTDVLDSWKNYKRLKIHMNLICDELMSAVTGTCA